MKYSKVQAYSYMRHRREKERANEIVKVYPKISDLSSQNFNLMNTKLSQARRFYDKLRLVCPHVP